MVGKEFGASEKIKCFFKKFNSVWRDNYTPKGRKRKEKILDSNEALDYVQ